MQIENIACNSCGAPLEVSATTQFATCRHCGAKLSIQRTDTAIFTEILEKLTTKTDQLSEQVNNLSGLTEVAALDREWELEREKYLVPGKHGRKHIPTEAGAIGGGIATTLFGCFWTAMAFGITSMAPSVGPFAIAKVGFPLFGLIAVIAGIVSSLNAYFKAGDYCRAEIEYRLRRAAIQRHTK